ncbi:P-loop containing nucleoside triphosphate hydrolase protein [Podospora didyma]|uniref:P-loop containing nucleoside triphosphate hydrolase protein n=1 Tax=Podospora didyma TaxID=330526 RepID=A0AAE0NYX6_9PEZI|nr:P-loop containing nucleoside triphosphate hydrolase protein [Podospora didyma]
MATTVNGNGHGQSSLDDLGNHIYLEKQDKLRDIGIDIQTSQIVVVGSQSSGKSSLLESLTSFSFPCGQGLCTRYATQITLRRHHVKSIVISITPRLNADSALTDRLRAFRHELEEFEEQDVASVIEKANEVMGIRSGEREHDMSLPMFSDDILKVEISGPERSHLTVIDVPGLFSVTDEGITTELDKTMVETMVQRYMENERTIVLAVMSCLADRATERVLQFAKVADPSGERTVGVLTKADLAKEKAVIHNLLDLVRGKTLNLGYYVVRNRGADESNLTISQCRMREKELFAEPKWAELAKLGRTGVQDLSMELRSLLTKLAKQELPKQRVEVTKRLADCQRIFNGMGPTRADSASQRECLTKLASRFERIIHDALEGRYEGHPVFDYKPDLKLITKIISLNEGFSDLMWKKGHTYNFAGKSQHKGDETTLDYETSTNEVLALGASFPELNDIIDTDNFHCDGPSDADIMELIDECYRNSRGPELGTFGGSLLAMTFRAQAKKWPDIVRSHVKVVIVLIHSAIEGFLETIFVDRRMREELWQTALLDQLLEAYRRALDHAQFLIDIELNGRPNTVNHYFNDNLQKARMNRITERMGMVLHEDVIVPKSALQCLAMSKSNADQVKEDIHDILKSYYKVSRKRFVDVICQQVIEHYLLDGSVSPLKVLTPELVTKMSDDTLEMIAGEEAGTKRERERLRNEIRGLQEALKVLRG